MSLREYFDQRAREGSWASLYDGARDLRTYNFVTRRESVAKLLAEDGPFERVLDVGCGTGDYVEIDAVRGASYVGVDFAPAMIAQARERYASMGHFGVAAGEELPFADASFDLVLALGYIAYFADPRPPFAEIHRVLRPGGTLIMQVTKPDLVGALDKRIIRPLQYGVRLRRPPRAPVPEGWVNLRYSGPALDRMAGEFGFVRRARAFNHFNALPASLRHRYPGAYVRLSEAMTRMRWGPWRPFSVNYIGKYEKRTQR